MGVRTGMSHSSVVESLLLPDEFPSCCFTNRGSTSPPSSPSTSAEQNIHSKEEGGGGGRVKQRRKQGEELQRLIGQRRVEEEKEVSGVEKIDVCE